MLHLIHDEYHDVLIGGTKNGEIFVRDSESGKFFIFTYGETEEDARLLMGGRDGSLKVWNISNNTLRESYASYF